MITATTRTATDPIDICAGGWTTVDDKNGGIDILTIDDPETGERTFDIAGFGNADVSAEGVADIRLTRELAVALLSELSALLGR